MNFDAYAELPSGLSIPRGQASDLNSYLTKTQPLSIGTIGGGNVSATEPFLWTVNPLEALIGVKPVESKAMQYGHFFARPTELYDLFDEMLDRDPTLSMALKYLCATVFRREAKFELEDDDDPTQIEIRDFLTAELVDDDLEFGWSQMTEGSLTYKKVHGFSVFESVWHLRPSKFRPGRKVYAPKAYIHRHPGQFAFDDFGQLYLQIGEGNNIRLVKAPPHKFIVHRSAGAYGDPFGESALYRLRWYYHFKKAALKSWIDFADKYGTPLLVAKIPAGAEHDRKKEIQKLEAEIKNLASRAGIKIEGGIDVEFISRLGGQARSVHEDLVRHFSREQVRELLGSTLAVLDNEGTGALAMAEVHGNTMAIRMKPEAKPLDRALNASVVKSMVELNFGTGVPIPRYVTDTDDVLDLEKAIKAIDAAIKWQIEVAKPTAREWLGIPAPKKSEMDDLIEPPASPIEDPGMDADLDREAQRQERGTQAKEPRRDDDTDEDDEAQMAEDVKKKEQALWFEHLAPTDSQLEQEFVGRLLNVSAALEAENMAEAKRVTAAALADLERSVTDPDSPLRADAAQGVIIPDFEPRSVEQGLTAAKILSHWINGKRIKTVAPETMFADRFAEAVPDDFRAAVEWMLARDVVSVDDVAEIAEMLALLNPEVSRQWFESQLRAEVLAIKGAVNQQIAQRFQQSISSAVREGKTAIEFFEQMRLLQDEGKIAILGDGYLQNVFRTETAHAYNAQREQQLQDPDFDPFYWGDELSNRDTEDSRDSHRAIDGLLVRKGSSAWQMSRPGPPWSYQCTCTRAPVVLADPDKAPFEERSDALELVMAITRFEDE